MTNSHHALVIGNPCSLERDTPGPPGRHDRGRPLASEVLTVLVGQMHDPDTLLVEMVGAGKFFDRLLVYYWSASRSGGAAL